jgi:hypothetical protein
VRFILIDVYGSEDIGFIPNNNCPAGIGRVIVMQQGSVQEAARERTGSSKEAYRKQQGSIQEAARKRTENHCKNRSRNDRERFANGA